MRRKKPAATPLGSVEILRIKLAIAAARADEVRRRYEDLRKVSPETMKLRFTV